MTSLTDAYSKASSSGRSSSPGKSATSPSCAKGKKIAPRVTLRLTEAEHAKLSELAHGMTLSAYIRACVFASDAAPRKRKKREPVKDEKAIAQLLGLLGQSRVANNLNQLAYAANSGSLLFDDETQAMIFEAYQHVCFMRSQLILALGISDSAKSKLPPR